MAKGVLTLVALLLAVATAGLALCMALPLRWSGVGRFGALALFFPLHLLVLTGAAMLLAWLARRSRASLARGLFGATAILSLFMALVPALAMWQRARALGVSLSVGEYLAN